jgi:hypothetical protein
MFWVIFARNRIVPDRYHVNWKATGLGTLAADSTSGRYLEQDGVVNTAHTRFCCSLADIVALTELPLRQCSSHPLYSSSRHTGFHSTKSLLAIGVPSLVRGLPYFLISEALLTHGPLSITCLMVEGSRDSAGRADHSLVTRGISSRYKRR